MYFPLFLDLSEKNILVAGAGRIACRRIRVLCGYAGHITVVALRICEEFYIQGELTDSSWQGQTGAAFEKENGIQKEDIEPKAVSLQSNETVMIVIERCFRESDLDEKDMVLAATDDDELNHQIACLCHKRGIPVNVCSDAKACDFQFPSVVETNGIVIGMNASGVDHRLVKETRKQVETLFEEADFHSRYGS